MENDNSERYTTGNDALDGAIYARLGELEQAIDRYSPGFDRAKLEAAFQFAAKAHTGTLRKDGSPYITHPLETAIILTELCLDLDTIVAALLHDVIEDTDYTFDDIARPFGTDVARIVDGVSKLTRMDFSAKSDEHAANLRKMLVAMSRDIRVLFVKVADRLHNMRTIQYQSEKKVVEKSEETLKIYAPLAYRIGVHRIKTELEDIAFMRLHPEEHREILEKISLQERRDDNADGTETPKFLSQVTEEMRAKFSGDGIKATLSGRVKQLYSVWRKMYTQNKSLHEIYDLYAVRVIVENETDCYAALGSVHDLYKPLPGRIKDYIHAPKPNGYRSLHTTVVGPEGWVFEVQIRTREMHETAEYGIAAHWKYKRRDGAGIDARFNWVRLLLDAQSDADSEEVLQSLSTAMYSDEVFVFTPQGDIKNLPQGANTIDFAYSVHTNVGNCMVGAKVNGHIVPIITELKNGEFVEILTQKGATPKRDWLRLVKTSEARSKIRKWFKDERREENVEKGREAFDAELETRKIPRELIKKEEKFLCRNSDYSKLDDLYAAIGYEGVTAAKAVSRIQDELVKAHKFTPEREETAPPPAPPVKVRKNPPKPGAVNIIAAGVSNCEVKLAKCCAPVPGDDIIGFVTRGFGISAHIRTCKNCTPELAPDRYVPAAWGDNSATRFMTGIEIHADEREGLTVDISTALQQMKIGMTSFNAHTFDNGESVFKLTVRVDGLEQLETVKSRMRGIRSVTSVNRTGYS